MMSLTSCDVSMFNASSRMSRSTLYWQKKKEGQRHPPKDTSPYSLYHKKVVQKCFIDEELLKEKDAYVIKAKFKVLQGQEKIVIMISPTIHPIQILGRYM